VCLCVTFPDIHLGQFPTFLFHYPEHFPGTPSVNLSDDSPDIPGKSPENPPDDPPLLEMPSELFPADFSLGIFSPQILPWTIISLRPNFPENLRGQTAGNFFRKIPLNNFPRCQLRATAKAACFILVVLDAIYRRLLKPAAFV